MENENNRLLDTSHLTTLAGLSGATIIATNTLVGVFDLPAKTTAFAVALSLCLAMAIFSGQRSGKHLLVAALNGMLICPAAMGANTVAGNVEKAVTPKPEAFSLSDPDKPNPPAVPQPLPTSRITTKTSPTKPSSAALLPTLPPTHRKRNTRPRPTPTPTRRSHILRDLATRPSATATPIFTPEPGTLPDIPSVIWTEKPSSPPEQAVITQRVFREW